MLTRYYTEVNHLKLGLALLSSYYKFGTAYSLQDFPPSCRLGQGLQALVIFSPNLELNIMN